MSACSSVAKKFAVDLCAQPLAAKTIALLHDEAKNITAIKSTARIKLSNGYGEQVFTTAMIIAKPDKLRIEAMTPWGAPSIFITVRGNQVRAFLPYENKFYTGTITKERIENYLSLSADITEIIEILFGTPHLVSSLPLYGDSCEAESEFLYRFDVTLTGQQRSLWLDMQEQKIRKYRGQSHDSAFNVSYTTPKDQRFPQCIQISTEAASSQSVEIEYQEVQFLTEIEDNLFTLTTPPEAEVINID